MQISSRFDGGAVEVVDASDGQNVRLRVRPDTAADFAQWFYFRVDGMAEQRCTYRFENAAQCAFPGGWQGYRVVASYDTENWFRVDAEYDGQVLAFSHRAEHDTVYYAYFEPYGEARHHQFLGRIRRQGIARVHSVGDSVAGRALECVTVGKDNGTAGEPTPVIWIVARQHPGETMAEWFVEGLLKRLLGLDDWAGDPVGRLLREHARFHVVPNINPDGAALGNLRTNAAGANLNREWLTPSATHSPEVLHVRNAIEQTGCDMFFDIHGDETLPYVFVAGSEMLPDFTERQTLEQRHFVDAFKTASPDFQDRYGYEADKYREDALKLASKYFAHRYRCLSLTLEMPFKDNADLPDGIHGWSGARSSALGAAMLQAVLAQVRAFPKSATQ
ncbi:Murein tripeptide amidase MpaA [Chitinasiproducens palmae]|uniref:Murein tripeptide amidase MpaA n=2 Tax=Chitinasiproducens palmae TaxID=1770053 RepID=A0A1H2PSI9_9BURK|nr:Murein tripeptide amidase MpaA [Chitinasiproducens palmae]